MKSWMTGLLGLAVLACGVVPARADIVQIATPGGLSGGDTTLPGYPGADGSSFASGTTIVNGAESITISNANSQAFLRVDQGNTWTPGAFPNGTQLLWNLNANTNLSGGTVTISFVAPVAEVGFFVQQDDTQPGNTTFSFRGFNGGTGFTTFNSVSSNTANPPNGTLTFIGLKGTSGDLISSLTISSSDSSGLGQANDFVLGPLTYGTVAAVPEPSPILMGSVLSAGLALVGAWRRRVQTKTAA